MNMRNNSEGCAPTLSDHIRDAVTELATVAANPRLQTALPHLNRVMNCLRHMQVNECCPEMLERARSSCRELEALLKTVEQPKPKVKKPRLRLYSGESTKIV